MVGKQIVPTKSIDGVIEIYAEPVNYRVANKDTAHVKIRYINTTSDTVYFMSKSHFMYLGDCFGYDELHEYYSNSDSLSWLYTIFPDAHYLVSDPYGSKQKNTELRIETSVLLPLDSLMIQAAFYIETSRRGKEEYCIVNDSRNIEISIDSAASNIPQNYHFHSGRLKTSPIEIEIVDGLKQKR